MEFVRGILKIWNKKGSRYELKGSANLTKRKWKDKTSSLDPQQVKVVLIQDVNIGDCHDKIQTFLAKCKHCSQLIIEGATDNTTNNADLSQFLSASFRLMVQLLRVDIRNVELVDGWQDVLSAVPSFIKSFTLKRVDLVNQGEKLSDTLISRNDIKVLNLGYSGMRGYELIGVLITLPHSCHELKVLILVSNNLSCHWKLFTDVVEHLPKLVLLDIEDCQLSTTNVNVVMQKINKEVEILEIQNNDTSSDKQLDLECIKLLKSIKFIVVSSDQVSSNLTELKSILLNTEGEVLVTPCEDSEMKLYYAYYNKLCTTFIIE